MFLKKEIQSMREKKGVQTTLVITLALLACVYSFSYAQDFGNHQSGTTIKNWYMYWRNKADVGNYAEVTDYDYQPQKEYALVWSRIYDSDNDTETTTQELYDAITNSVATACLYQRNSRNEVLKKFKEERPLDKLRPVQDMASREYILLNCLKSTSTKMKSLDEIKKTFEDSDKALRITSKE